MDYSSSAADNGLGLPAGFDTPKRCLGTGIVQALAGRPGPQVATSSNEIGTRVSIRKMAPRKRIPAAV